MNAILESSEVYESFKARAGAVGACVERVANKASALEFVVRQLRQEGVSEKPRTGAVWAGCAMVNPSDQKKLEAEVPGLKFAVTRDLAESARVGISQVDWALADTGTLVQCADEVDKRLVSTLPAVHIALLATSALLPDLGSVVARMDPRKSAYLSFITGPSRTANVSAARTDYVLLCFVFLMKFYFFH